MSADPKAVDVPAVLKEASGFAQQQSYELPTNDECEQAEALMIQIDAVIAAVAELFETLQPIADGRVGRGKFTALDLIHEYQRIVRAALARCGGAS